MSQRGVIIASNATIAATSTSANANIGSVSDIVIVQNVGTKICYVRLGGANVVAATSDFPVQPDYVVALDSGGNQYIAAICGGSDTTTMYASACAGNLYVGAVPGGGTGPAPPTYVPTYYIYGF
jgi:hypothetical protein